MAQRKINGNKIKFEIVHLKGDMRVQKGTYWSSLSKVASQLNSIMIQQEFEGC